MKKINIFIIAAVMLLSSVIVSCTRDVLPTLSEGQISLNVEIDEPDVVTKAFPDSQDNLNENRIKSINYFIYKEEGQNAVISGHLETDTIRQKSFIIDLKAADFNDLFPNDNDTVLVYAVVNLPESVTIPSNATIPTVENAVVAANFTATQIQDCFVMSGRSVLRRSDNTANGHIVVKRIAAKITFEIDAEESCHEDDEDPSSPLWYSHPEAISVQFYNLVSKSVVKGGASAISKASTSLFTFNNEAMRAQYYSYPRTWDLGDTDEPFIFITMPVTKGSFDSSERRDCYYKVVLTNTSFESNAWYKYSIHLKMIGSFEKVNPVVPTPKDAKFFVYRWGGHYGYSGSSTAGQITGIRYLEVEGNTTGKVFYMYNQNTLSIPYVTSHDCEIVNLSATSLSFTNQNAVGTVDRTSDVQVSFNSDRTAIVVNHVINNNTSVEGYDYSPITIRFTIHHHTDDPTTDAKYTQDLTVVQYPALYIDAQKNSARNSNGCVLVNGSTSSYGGVHGLSGSGNTNPNMYIVTTSFLNNGDVLSDPRKKTVDNLYTTGTNPSASMVSIENPSGTTRKMSYYYPTDDSASASNVIAPKFRIASSYGVTNTISYDNAVKRCAYYQEDGYPAGRWRLPTKAEIEYINKLSADGVFPALFTASSTYWCATGYCQAGVVTESLSGSRYVRCVYDEWYWENTAYPRAEAANYNIGMWGDQPR